jgi:plasmid stabilization system protein ParE
MTVRISEDAKTDIKEIYIYSYQNFGERKADEYVDELNTMLDELPNALRVSDYGFVREELKCSNCRHFLIVRSVSSSPLTLLQAPGYLMTPRN